MERIETENLRNRKSKKEKIKEREKKGREKEMGVKGNSP